MESHYADFDRATGEFKLPQSFVHASQLDRLLDGHPERRYQLRALKAGELTRFRRAVPTFGGGHSLLCHKHCYRALCQHGNSPVPSRLDSRSGLYNGLHHAPSQKPILPLASGIWNSTPWPSNPALSWSWCRVEFSGQHALVASPLRALMDLVCYRKLPWQGLEWFEGSLRIDPELLRQTTKKSMKALRRTYRHKRVQQYLESFARELGLLTKDSQ